MNGPTPTGSIWDPISTDKPSKVDTLLNSKFESFLDKIEPLATESEINERKVILNDIQKIVNKWIHEVSQKQGFIGEALKTACGKVFTFGSFRLGLVTPGSDIDTLVVAPRHITRDDFFNSLLPILESNPNVSELAGVPDAVVPIIKMRYKTVDVDLTFARLNLSVIDSKLESLESNNLIKHLDDKTVRSINGTRVADALISHVPNAKTYRTVLRFVRHWARKRGLYSNAVGFFGGITWAILSARVCQMYPNYLPLQTVLKFFQVFSRWNWSNPVTVCPITQSTEVGLMGFKVWNPKVNASDKYHLMPVITPSFPCMNSTYNVSETTKRILVAEFGRAAKAMAAVVEQETQNLAETEKRQKSKKKDTDDSLVSFSSLRLIQSPALLSLFSHYIIVDVVADTIDQMNKFKGFVESRIRLFFRYLEHTPGVDFVRPWPAEVVLSDGKELPAGSPRSCWVLGLSLAAGSGTCDLRTAFSQFLDKVADYVQSGVEVGGANTDVSVNGSTAPAVRLFHVSRQHDFVKSVLGPACPSELSDPQVAEWLERLQSDREDLPAVWSAAAQETDTGKRQRRAEIQLDIQVDL